MLHVTNGDSVAETLRDSGLPGDVAISADVLHEGPCPTGADEPAFRETRARYLADAGYAPYDEILARLVHSDAMLDAAGDADEIVLWFEHDLFDQLQLLRVLARCARRGPARAALSLICIGAYPGVSRFHGLGQLSIAQLRGLFPDRNLVTPAQLQLAADAWRRFGADDPRPFAALLTENTTPLPYLAGAVRRQLEELPSTRNGLSRTEHQALAAIAAGAGDVALAFRSTQEMEERVFMGDVSFAGAVRALGDAGLPLVRLDLPSPHVELARQAVTLTPFGRHVLAGRADHVTVNGIDRWVGGVRLQGRTVGWRWDVEKGRLSGEQSSLIR